MKQKNPAGRFHFGKSHRQIVKENTTNIQKTSQTWRDVNRSNFEEVATKGTGHMIQTLYPEIAGEMENKRLRIGFVPQASDLVDSVEFQTAKSNWVSLSTKKQWLESEQKIIPLLKWLNSIDQTTTTDACSGHDDSKGNPYVGFLPANVEEGIEILKTVENMAGKENLDHWSARLAQLTLFPDNKEIRVAGPVYIQVVFKPEKASIAFDRIKNATEISST